MAIAATDHVQALERGFAVIRAFDGEHAELTLSEVARIAQLPRASARRFLHTLVALGYARTDGRLFALRPRILELGYSFLSSIRLPEIAQPRLDELVARVHESSSVSVLDEHDVVYVARAATRRIMSVAINVGTRFPAYATSMGRVLLAAQPDEWLGEYLATAELRPLTRATVTDPDRLRALLDEVRANGYAFVDQELEDGLRSVAVPLRGRDGVIAAMNLSFHVSRADPAAIRTELLPALLETAGAISADLHAAGLV